MIPRVYKITYRKRAGRWMWLILDRLSDALIGQGEEPTRDSAKRVATLRKHQLSMSF